MNLKGDFFSIGGSGPAVGPIPATGLLRSGAGTHTRQGVQFQAWLDSSHSLDHRLMVRLRSYYPHPLPRIQILLLQRSEENSAWE
jgi:hypothetical protein